MSLETLGIIMGAIVLILATIIIVVLLWRGMEVARTQITADKDKGYVRLAEDSVAFQRRSTDAQEKTREAIEDIRARLTSLEKMLKEVS
jgi:hypothetical protein